MKAFTLSLLYPDNSKFENKKMHDKDLMCHLENCTGLMLTILKTEI